MSSLLYYGLSKSEYEKCSAQIKENTVKINRTLVGIGCITMTVLFIISLFFNQLYNFRKVYCIFSAIFMLLWVYSLKCRVQHPTGLIYVICCAFCIFGMLIALQYPGQKPTIVHLTFVVLPLMFADLPIRVFIYTLSMASLYILLGLKFQDIHLRFPEIYNTIVLFFISNIMHWIINNGRCNGYLACVTRDEAIIDLKKAQNQLLRLTEIDALTELKNRRKLFETLSSIQSDKIDVPDGIYMIDIDYFKALNDKFGHTAGDRFLNQFGKMLLDFEKSNNFSAYRYGGEEFVALVWDSNKDELAALAEQIRLSTAIIDIGQPKNVTASIGFVCCNDIGIFDYEKWIDLADTAVYEAKRLGRNRTICWNDLNEAVETLQFED